jgi:hypothetical protein
VAAVTADATTGDRVWAAAESWNGRATATCAAGSGVTDGATTIAAAVIAVTPAVSIERIEMSMSNPSRSESGSCEFTRVLLWRRNPPELRRSGYFALLPERAE